MENNRPENIRGKSLDAMSTANLQELLQAELDSDRDVDVEKVKAILAVLDERTEQKEVDVDAAWDRFFHNHLQSEPIVSMPEDTPTHKKGSRKKHLIRVGLIAALIAVFCLGAGLTASAAGYDVWDAVMQWSSETFGFSFGQNNGTSSMKTNPEYFELKEALVDAGVTEPLVPNYLPDGYKQTEFHNNNGCFVAMFENEDDSIFIRIQEIKTDDSTQLEKDNIQLETYTVDGVNHYISTNMGEHISVWSNAGFECAILGAPTKIDLYKMIDSIYVGD